MNTTEELEAIFNKKEAALEATPQNKALLVAFDACKRSAKPFKRINAAEAILYKAQMALAATPEFKAALAALNTYVSSKNSNHP